MMLKILIISALLACCSAQYSKQNIRRASAVDSPFYSRYRPGYSGITRLAPRDWSGTTGLPLNIGAVGNLGVAQSIYGAQWQGTPSLQYVSQGYQQVVPQVQAVQQVIPISTYRTQQILPVQDLGASDPVLVHYRTQSAPIRVETAHIASPPEEVTVTKHHEEPHRVIHEIHRPVIQEVREIIQPYRRITQEIRPVQEEVHTSVASNLGGNVKVIAETPTVVETPIAAPVVAAPVAPVAPIVDERRAIVREDVPLGVVAQPAPYITGSYIQQFIEQLRARQAPLASRPISRLTIPSLRGATPEIEPIASEKS